MRLGHGVGPVAAEILDETFGHANSAGPVRPDANVSEAQGEEGPSLTPWRHRRVISRSSPEAILFPGVKPGRGAVKKAD